MVRTVALLFLAFVGASIAFGFLPPLPAIFTFERFTAGALAVLLLDRLRG